MVNIGWYSMVIVWPPSNAGAVVVRECTVEAKSDSPLAPGFDESYTVLVESNGQCAIGGDTVWGALRALETLVQLVAFDGNRNGSLPVVGLVDEPRFPFRGMLLDSARHFLPVRLLEQQIDALAMGNYHFCFRLCSFHFLVCPIDTF